MLPSIHIDSITTEDGQCPLDSPHRIKWILSFAWKCNVLHGLTMRGLQKVRLCREIKWQCV